MIEGSSAAEASFVDSVLTAGEGLQSGWVVGVGEVDFCPTNACGLELRSALGLFRYLFALAFLSCVGSFPFFFSFFPPSLFACLFPVTSHWGVGQ